MPKDVCETVVGRRGADSTGKNPTTPKSGKEQKQGSNLDVVIEEFMAVMYPGLLDSSRIANIGE